MADQTTIQITPVMLKSFSLEFKRYDVCYIDNAVLNKVANIIDACEDLCIPHCYNSSWKKTLDKIDEMKRYPCLSLSNSMGRLIKIHPGHPSIFEDIRGDLSHSIFKLWEQAIQVNTRICKMKLVASSHMFNEMTMKAKKANVDCFVKKMDFTCRIGTHIVQKNHKEAEEEAMHSLWWSMRKLHRWTQKTS